MRRTDLHLALALALALLAPAAAFAGKKEDDYSKAVQAMNAGRVDEAAQLFCSVAQEDPGYKDAKINCKIMSDQAQREARRNEERFTSGVADFKAGKYDDAEQEFKNIRSGPHVNEAQQYLARIPAARQAQQAQAGDAAMEQKFQQAVAAYNRNDFNTAKGLFGQITGSHASEAQSYFNRMKQYEQAMAEGDTLANAKNYRQAASSYSEAAGIKSDGPGDPRSKAASMQQLMASSTAPSPSPTVAVTHTPTPPPRPVVAAVKETPKPQVDVDKLLREAEAAKNKGDIRTAQSKYIAVLAVDEHNATATSALAALQAQAEKQATPTTQKASSEADVMLAKAIREFYQGEYEQSEVHIQDYLDVNGSKTALGYFYKGASKLTRYYLGGGKDAHLMKEAQDLFRSAKKVPGFNPPGQNYVSPKILKVFEATS
ncbi:MAG TPA: hypothetical protein VE825_17525 [Terriglobales bacterium]|jgi:hypothetical protein|nr:hypothetical protein [Terriglobales bacterium]